MPVNSFIHLVLFLFWLPGNHVEAREPLPRGELRIMWYNVENLFHPSADSTWEDSEFTPEGVRHWTWKRYNRKITQLAKVIIAAGEWDPPDLIGLCEVENSLVLEDLVAHPILKSWNYKIIHRESQDHRGMDVASLYREKRLILNGWWVYPPVPSASLGKTRDMLHLCLTWGARDTLDLFLVHFISKYGGAGATADYRKSLVTSLAVRVDSVKRQRERTLVVSAGDFNEEFDGYSMEPLRSGELTMDLVRNLSPDHLKGSYKYRGRWSNIDQFLVRGERDQLLIVASILDLDVLVKPDDLYQGVKPSRTYEGFYYNGGISDHLPLLLDISHYPAPAHVER